jgi:hypothetical protein
MGACAGALLLALRWRNPAVALAGAAGLAAVLGALALWGPHLSAHEVAWLRDYALHREPVTSGILGDAANVATAVAAVLLLWKRRFRLVGASLAAVVALIALFKVLPFAALYPVRFAPLLLVAVAPLWAHAAAQRIPLLAPLGLLVALVGHLRWYQKAQPMATADDVAAIRCVERETPPAAVIDGAYGDATQWIPALAGRAITRPHEHVSLFDETDAALARLPKPSFRFLGQRLRYGEAAPAATGEALCSGKLLRLQ